MKTSTTSRPGFQAFLSLCLSSRQHLTQEDRMGFYFLHPLFEALDHPFTLMFAGLSQQSLQQGSSTGRPMSANIAIGKRAGNTGRKMSANEERT
ncbi:hypothetical protein EPA93_12820 [Ktedonosporobacter rubrisoli]|uniref:Uncharacterized protein n=1 Tax=Ktedonosporobacter rubrisoli TaxID=2509675 RepID=A0A4P6JNF6_KTERU|nr:hypothetical protein [Ktedonosporobacter rubrisoli]QBD76839.1 hypothetical protein EPA93_12820 [Ktedonosporobacter rubrisoli]